MTWKLKVDEESNNPIMQDGKPVYIDPDGKELALDPPAMYQKITELGDQNKIDRDKYTQIRDTYADFKDIEDVVKWKKEADKAIENQKNWKDEDWMKADKVEKLKKEMKDSYEEKLNNKEIAIGEIEKNYVDKIQGKDAQIRHLLVSNQFAGSKFFNGAKPITILKPDMAESFFGKNFRVEIDNDQTVLRAYYDNGDLVRSKQNPGEPAEFDEAMEFIIDRYAHKDSIIPSGGPGSGSGGGHGDDHGEKDDLTKLQEQYAEAQEKRDPVLMASLTRRISELQNSA